MQTQCQYCEQTMNITGDGSHAFLTDAAEGGIYFCTHQCKEAWRKQNVRHSLSGVVTGIGSQRIAFSNYDEYKRIVDQQHKRQ